MRRIVAALAMAVLGACEGTVDAQTCDQTLSVGANVAAAVASAPDDSAICLNSGDYGLVHVEDVHRTGWVTVQPAAGATPTVYALLENSSFIRLQGLTHPGSEIRNNTSHHLEFVDCTFVQDGDGLALNGLNDNPPATTQEIVIDGCDFTNVSIALWDGRLNVRGMNGVKIRNSTIAGSTNPGQKSDGIQLIGQSTNTEIGPGNVFHGFHQEDATQGEHIDCIQFFGAGSGNRIFDNYFYDSDVFIGAFSQESDITVENNVFNASDRASRTEFQSIQNLVYRHNTWRGTMGAPLIDDPRPGDPPNSNNTIENNIFADGSNPSIVSCSGCFIDSNLYESGSGPGTNIITGNPTFVGGTDPITYEGHFLASGSAGENAGNDGLDVGVVGEAGPPPIQIETAVNLGTAASNTGTSVAVTTTSAVPVGATVFVVMGESGLGVHDEPRPTAGDPVNGLYGQDIYTQSDSGLTNLSVWRFNNSAALPSGTVITVNVCAPDKSKSVTAFYVESTSPLVLDQSVSASSPEVSTSAATGNVTTSTDDQFMLGVVAIWRNDRVTTQDTDFLSTIAGTETTGGDPWANREIFIGDRIITTAETNNYGVTFDNVTGWNIALLTYKLQ